MKISEGIKNIQFYGLIDYDFAKGFNLISEADYIQFKNKSIGSKLKNFIHLFLKILQTLLTPLFVPHYNHAKQNKIIFILAPPDVQKRRNDIYQMFNNVCNLTNSCDQLYFSYTNLYKFSFKRSIRLIVLILYWSIQLTHCKLSIRKKTRILYELTQLYDLQNILNNLYLYKLVLVFYDANLYNNFIIQYFKSKNCKTATLQHGVMVASRENIENNLDFKGIEFNGFISDYFLAWNDFTKREAIKSGIPSHKIIILGVVKCLGKKQLRINLHKKNCLGILLDGIYSNINNERLIKVINNFCIITNSNYIVKYHPAYKGNEFESLINEHGRVLPINSPIEKLIEATDAIIVANSTALFELAYLNINFYRFKSENSIDKYRDLEIPMFSNEYELLNISKNDIEYSEQNKKELFGNIKDVDLSYYSFLNKFI